jgi:hypothetical protein
MQICCLLLRLQTSNEWCSWMLQVIQMSRCRDNAAVQDYEMIQMDMTTATCVVAYPILSIATQHHPYVSYDAC